ncbi:hypothetical protein Hanom_Chr02g00114331 [Helianthus anomalus]
MLALYLVIIIGPYSQSIGQGRISSLPKYDFKMSIGDVDQPDVRACKMISMGTNGLDFSIERTLEIEDAVCFFLPTG